MDDYVKKKEDEFLFSYLNNHLLARYESDEIILNFLAHVTLP
jgi:hypothetical protein